ncbi:glycosyltransferase family 10 domain-containing protein [Ensifer sp.]|uniref:glycosyltransferase family 10 domain-containing protein n=1 Tax=Ensifer sp. TaxID=1872086 RepID=UPI00289E99CF|nr:glycosyltransferase family 10 [Ensifer sp.]
MQAIIYDPQQTNMENIFSAPGVAGKEDDVWHSIQSHFREIGFELYTPSSYRGRLEDVRWIIFQNVPEDFRPTNLRRRVKRYVRGFTSRRTFYQRCLKAGLADNLAVILYEPKVVAEFNYDKDVHKHFSVVFTWDQDLFSEGLPYSEFVYPQPDFKALTGLVPFEQRKLICNFSANKTSAHPDELYTARIRTIKFFEANCLSEIDHYGRGWSQDYKSWRGMVDDKQSVMSNYRFNLCYENARSPRGYVTEKVFDALRAGCVPVYWGAPDIEDRIPADAFIDRRNFPSDADLLDFIQGVNEPQWQRYVDAGQRFLQSEAYKRYTSGGIFNLLRAGLFRTA